MQHKTKNPFKARARHALVNADLTVTTLAERLGRPRETVSRAIHGAAFPRVRREIAQALQIAL
jgi:plasmid maintenance system antidote protein VapI